MSELGLAYTLAKRDLRGGLRGLRLLIACLVLGVSAIAGVGSLSQSILSTMTDKGQILLGGDIELRLTNRPATLAQTEQFARYGAVSSVTKLRAMVRLPATNKSLLGELKAVDAGYPLYGRFELEDGTALQAQLAASGTVMDKTLATRIGAKLGDKVQIGTARFVLRAFIRTEPDRASDGFALGPSVFIAAKDLAATGLTQPGALARYHYRLKVLPAIDVKALTGRIRKAYEKEDWRIEDRSNGAPGVRRFVDQLGQFLILVGLTAMMVSGLGVANAVNAHLERKTGAIATLKSLGASSALIFRIWLIEIALVTIGAIVIGLLLGGMVPIVGAKVLANQLPVPPQPGIYPQALALAAAFGLLVALAATLWPLARARETPPARLFRAKIAGLDPRPKLRFIVIIAVAVLLSVGLGVIGSSDKMLALGVILGCAGLLLILRFFAWGLAAIARRLPPAKQPLLRLAVANLHRPGSAAPAVITALGLGLSLFATLAVVQANLSEQVNKSLPKEAPAFFMVDIPPDEIEAFRETVRAVPSIGRLETVPSLRGPLVAIKGIPVADYKPVDPQQAWVLRGDRGLTYARDLPKDNIITAGTWWPKNYAGPPLVSFDAEQAAALGVKVGDEITVSVLGTEITAKIASLRQVDWSSLGFNFVILFAPGALEDAPHTFMATVMANGSAEAGVYEAVTAKFPTVSVVRMKEVLTQVATLLRQVEAAVRATAFVTVLAGILVLIGAMATVQQARTYDAVILKMLGATRLQVLRSYIGEYLLLGLIAGTIAVASGALAGMFVVIKVLELPWIMPWRTLMGTVAGGAFITICFSLAGAYAVLRTRPNAALREMVG
jgi:putative ABC transport system permease protein